LAVLAGGLWEAGGAGVSEREVLAHDPFQGDFGDPGDRTLSDKVVTARKAAKCHDCGGPIVPKERIRSRTDICEGNIMSFRWCSLCCEAMAVYGEHPEVLDARIASRITA
jgi:hypothetical protein